ncbi:GDSL-type esterase/lipase family protein [Streptomyces sp. 549]|uniref:SGNH/GDSL hydrolase family protein n=1 Tax=Streptomyces sp. 549 TaxID=3049076 RepID=UPI0024C26368|nr:GDSL-type esterase/lipase family protein [Streptomyces sp. 549]MDK1472181.1 GDSL-type esterase/lipase family protein [Streptomyces sp. 549]
MRIRAYGTAVVLTLTAASVPAGPAVSAVPAESAESVRHPAADRAALPRPLERLYDNRAASRDDRPGEADFDGAGNSFSADALAGAGWTPGRRLLVDGALVRVPAAAPGRPDNVRADGQRVRVRGRGDAVSFLVAASSPGAPGTQMRARGQVHYLDGGRSAYTLTAGDWRGGPTATKAVALPYLNTPEGTRAERPRLYVVTVPVARGRTLASVELPRDPGRAADLHVFDVALQQPADGWTGTWAASTGGYARVGPWTDRTLRLVVHTSAGGSSARVRFANTFADAPLHIGRATVAVRAAGAAAAGRPRELTFGRQTTARVPAGAQLVSDPVGLDVPPDADLLVSLHLPGTVTAAPVHSEAVQTSYVSAEDAGDRTGQAGGEGFRGELRGWPFLTGVDVRGGPGSVVTLGDSITDGVASTPGANRRWPDVLARRLQRADGRGVPRYGVLNHGISANRVVSDRYDGDGVSSDTGGVSAVHRLDRDVLGQTGVRTVVLFQGVNDVRWGYSAQSVIEGLRALADRSRQRGLRVVGATVAPCGGWPDCSAEVERQRQQVNAFVRDHGGTFDAVLDFDAVLRDPGDPRRLLPQYDSGDHLHPGDAGLRALADSVDLSALVPRAPRR